MLSGLKVGDDTAAVCVALKRSIIKLEKVVGDVNLEPLFLLLSEEESGVLAAIVKGALKDGCADYEAVAQMLAVGIPVIETRVLGIHVKLPPVQNPAQLGNAAYAFAALCAPPPAAGLP